MHTSYISCIFVVILSLLYSSGAQICPGYNYGFLPNDGDIQGGSPWDIVDGNCMINGNCYLDNPCDCPNLDCAPGNTTFTWNSTWSGHVQAVQVEGLWYACHPDVNAGSCRDHPVQSCCCNDAKRNLAEGIINHRQYSVIKETHKVLDKHKREFEIAVKRGASEWEIEALREIHRRDLQEAMERETAAGV